MDSPQSLSTLHGFHQVWRDDYHLDDVRAKPECRNCVRCCDVKSTSMTLIQRRNNVVCPVDRFFPQQFLSTPRF